MFLCHLKSTIHSVCFHILFGDDIINLFSCTFLLFKPFLPKDDTHYYFFRKWRKDDLKYYSEMEYLNVSKQPMSRVNHFQNMYTSISCLEMRVYLKIIKTPL